MSKPTRGGKRTGAGRKRSKDGTAVTISLSMPQAILGLLEAQRNGRSRSKTIQEIVTRQHEGRIKALEYLADRRESYGKHLNRFESGVLLGLEIAINSFL